MKNYILLFLLFAGFALSLFYTLRHQTEDYDLVGKPVPVFETATLDGEKLHLADLIGKKVLLINIWATHCGPCQDEMPVLNSLYKALSPEKFDLISVMEDDRPTIAEVRTLLNRFEKKIPLPFKVYHDKGGVIADLFGTYMIPETFLVGLDGKIAEHYRGAISDYEKDKVLRRISQLMGTVE